MPTSNQYRGDKGIASLVNDFCWGAWAELGVSGWGRTHQDWAIDPEPLIIFTAVIGQEEPRLRDEAMDWCIRNWRHLSQIRLRNILRLQSERVTEAWGVFAATVNARAGVRWPGATVERSSYKVTGRSSLRSLSEPSLVILRMRAMFGVGARTEILRFFLLNPRSKVTAAILAESTNFMKRNVAEECDLLVQADVLTVKIVGNRFYYSLTNSRELANFVGAIPSIAPDWMALLRVVRVIKSIAETAEEFSHDALVVETHQAARTIEDDLSALGIDGPRRLRGPAFLNAWDQWAGETMADLAAGTWPAEEDELPVTALRSNGRTRRTKSLLKNSG
jgi:hypothetical protein